MNIKLVKLRIINKKLKSKLKEYKQSVFLKEKDKLDLKSRIALINHLEDNIENEKNKNRYLKESNKEYIFESFTLSQENSRLERDLTACKSELAGIKTIAKDYKLMCEGYKANSQRLSVDVIELTKENEHYKSNRIASKLKTILGIR